MPSTVAIQGVVLVGKAKERGFLSGSPWKRRHCSLEYFDHPYTWGRLTVSKLNGDQPQKKVASTDITIVNGSTQINQEQSKDFKPIVHIISFVGETKQKKSLMFESAAEEAKWLGHIKLIIDLCSNNTGNTLLQASSQLSSTGVGNTDIKTSTNVDAFRKHTEELIVQNAEEHDGSDSESSWYSARDRTRLDTHFLTSSSVPSSLNEDNENIAQNRGLLRSASEHVSPKKSPKKRLDNSHTEISALSTDTNNPVLSSSSLLVSSLVSNLILETKSPKDSPKVYADIDLRPRETAVESSLQIATTTDKSLLQGIVDSSSALITVAKSPTSRSNMSDDPNNNPSARKPPSLRKVPSVILSRKVIDTAAIVDISGAKKNEPADLAEASTTINNSDDIPADQRSPLNVVKPSMDVVNNANAPHNSTLLFRKVVPNENKSVGGIGTPQVYTPKESINKQATGVNSISTNGSSTPGKSYDLSDSLLTSTGLGTTFEFGANTTSRVPLPVWKVPDPSLLQASKAVLESDILAGDTGIPLVHKIGEDHHKRQRPTGSAIPLDLNPTPGPSRLSSRPAVAMRPNVVSSTVNNGSAGNNDNLATRWNNNSPLLKNGTRDNGVINSYDGLIKNNKTDLLDKRGPPTGNMSSDRSRDVIGDFNAVSAVGRNHSVIELELMAVVSLNKELNATMEMQEIAHSKDLEGLRAQISALTQENERLHESCESLEERARFSEMQNKELQNEVSRLVVANDQLKSSLSSVNEDAAEIARSKSDLIIEADDTVTKLKEHLADLELKFNASESELEGLRRLWQSSKSQGGDLETNLILLQSQLKNKEKELDRSERLAQELKLTIDELKSKLRYSLSSSSDLEQRLSAEIEDEMKNETRRLTMLEQERNSMVASLELCRAEICNLSKENEEAKAKLVLKDMYISALSKDSQEAKMSHLEQELNALRSNVTSIETQKRKLMEDLDSAQQAVFDEKSKSLVITEELLSIKTQLRQKESSMTIIEDDSAKKYRHLTAEISQLNADISSSSRQLETQRAMLEKSEKAYTELQLKYSADRILHGKTVSELQQSLEIALATSSAIQHRLASKEEEVKSDMSRVLQKNKDLEDAMLALNQSLTGIRYKLLNAENQNESCTKSIQNHIATISRLEQDAEFASATHKKETDRLNARIVDLSDSLEASQKLLMELRQKLSDVELSRSGEDVQQKLSLHDAVARYTISCRELSSEQSLRIQITNEFDEYRTATQGQLKELRCRVSEYEDCVKELERHVSDLKHALSSSESRCCIISTDLEKASRHQEDLNSCRSIADELQRQLLNIERQRDDLLSSNSSLTNEVKMLFEFKQNCLIRENDNMRSLEAAQALSVEHLNRQREAEDSLHTIKIELDATKKALIEHYNQISELKSALATEKEKNRTLEALNASVSQTSKAREKTIKKRTSELAELQQQFSDLRVREGILMTEITQKDAIISNLKSEIDLAITSQDKIRASCRSAEQELHILNQRCNESEKSLQLSLERNVELETSVRLLEDELLKLKQKAGNMTDNETVVKQLEDLNSNWMSKVDATAKVVASKDLHIADLRSCVERAIISIYECDEIICSAICHKDISKMNDNDESDPRLLINDQCEKINSLEQLRIALSYLKVHVNELDTTASSLNQQVAWICKQLLRDRNLGGIAISDIRENATTRHSANDLEDDAIISTSPRFKQLVNMPIEAGSDMGTFCRVLAMDDIIHDKYRIGEDRRQLSTSSIGLKFLATSLSEAYDWYMSAQQCIQEEKAKRLESITEKQRAVQTKLKLKISELEQELEALKVSSRSELESRLNDVRYLQQQIEALNKEKDNLKATASDRAKEIKTLKDDNTASRKINAQIESELQRIEFLLAKETKAKKDLELICRRSLNRDASSRLESDSALNGKIMRLSNVNIEYSCNRSEADSPSDSDSYSMGFETSVVDDSIIDESLGTSAAISKPRFSSPAVITPGVFTRAVLASRGDRRGSDVVGDKSGGSDLSSSIFKAALISPESPNKDTMMSVSHNNKLKEKLNIK